MARNRDTWYRLDTVGKFYSSQAGGHSQTVFRYSATLVDEVDPAVLQHALEKTVDSFPGFNVSLRDGLFWHYLQQAPNVPRVTPENLPICYGLHADAHSVLFRVSHYGPRINFEVSHIVSDGRGSMGFFKALLRLYLQERYQLGPIPPEDLGSSSQKAENSFDKYFDRASAAGERVSRAYRMAGWREKSDPTFMEYHLPVAPVLGLARSWGVSLTSLVVAVLMVAIRDEMRERDRKRAIRFDVPVDLRQYFSSSTARNFFALAYVSHVPGAEDVPVEVLATQVHDQLKASAGLPSVRRRMNRNTALEKSLSLRFAPLLVKDFVLGIADRLVARDTTATVSNLGAIRLDERLEPYVRDINILTSTTGFKMTVCSFKDDLSIGIATDYVSHNVVKNFCRFFSGRGVYGRINMSKTSEEVAEDHLEAALEARVKRLGESRGEAVR